eukprot:891641-Pleurochrysis_carterae.AAC.1
MALLASMPPWCHSLNHPSASHAGQEIFKCPESVPARAATYPSCFHERKKGAEISSECARFNPYEKLARGVSRRILAKLKAFLVIKGRVKLEEQSDSPNAIGYIAIS